MHSPTLSDVAQAAGVSYATADRVINRRGNVAQKSIAKVQAAVTALGYVRNIAAANLSRGRVYRLAFLIPAGRTAFYANIRQIITTAAQHLSVDQISVEIIDVAAFAVDSLQRSITELASRDVDGVAIVGLQSPALTRPLHLLRQKGVAIVGLVSDLPEDSRAAYIGINNRAAGRTAARMVGLAHGGGPGRVKIFAGSLEARDHAERLAGFCEVMAEDFPDLDVLDPHITNDDAGVLRSHAQITPDITALYNVGAGNSGLIAALRGGPAKRPFCVVHELVPHARQALVDRHVDLVIDQRPDIEIMRAFTVLRALIDDQPPPPMPDLVPTIYVRDNLPNDTFTHP